MRSINRVTIAIVATAVILVGAVGADAAPSPQATTPVSKAGITVRQDVTTLVQARLKQYGYTIVVDGIYGPQTTAVVRAWQHANGLHEDGIAGTQTLASLRLTGTNADSLVAIANPPEPKPAKRLNPPAAQPAPAGDVESIIRDVWPDEFEDGAVRIAKRESSLVPTAANSCCYGLFQIHFRAHRAWLGDFGVNQPSDLFDPRTNATVALALFQAEGNSWSPAWDL